MTRSPSDTPTSPPFRITAEYLFTAVSAWLLPGSGHWFLGHRGRGVVLGGTILGIFWLGEVMAVPPPESGHERRPPIAVTRTVHPIFFCCQVGNGFSALMANTLWGKPLYPDRGASSQPDPHLPTYLNLAILFTSVSGLLNYLLVLHVLDPRTWKERRAAMARGAAQAATARGGAP